MSSILEDINDNVDKKNEFYENIFNLVKPENIFSEKSEERMQECKSLFADSLIRSYKNMLSKNVQEETIDKEEKSTISQQFKEIVFLHNEHDVLCIAAHVNKEQINGFERVKVSYGECEDDHGIVRQYIYNYSDNELEKLARYNEEIEQIGELRQRVSIVEEQQENENKQHYSEEESKEISRSLTENEEYSEILRAGNLVRADLENEHDLNHRSD